MQWPSRSETFCARDIAALRDMGANQVNVIALRPAPSNADRLLENLHVTDILSASGSFPAYIQGILLGLCNPVLLLELLGCCLKERGIECVKLAFFIPLYFWAFNIIEKTKPDAVHLFWGHYPAGVGYLLRRKMSNLRLTMFLGAYDLMKNLSLSHDVARKADALVTHAQANRTLLDQYGFDTSRLHVIHRGIDIAGIEKHNTQQIRDPHRIIIVSRLIADKGTHLVVDALPHILRHYPDVTLVIVGDGPEYDTLKTQAIMLGVSHHVKFLGFLSPAQVYDNLYQSSVFILPSASAGERLPNAVKEAMYAGLTPVVSHTPGIDELVTPETGYILNNLDAGSIAETICLAFTSPKTAGKTVISNGFDVRRNMMAYVNIWSGN